MEFTIETILKIILAAVAVITIILLVDFANDGSLNVLDKILGFVK